MKKLILLTLFVTFISCETEKKEDLLLGSWLGYQDNELTEFNFTKDSLVINTRYGKEVKKWKLDKDTLVLSSKNFMQKDVRFLCILDETKEKLFMGKKYIKDFDINVYKAQNLIEYFSKAKGIKFQEIDCSTIIETNTFKQFNIYLTNGDKFPEISTDYSEGVENIKIDFESYKARIRSNINTQIGILLFIDKNVNQKEIDNLINYLKTNISGYNIYRVCKTQEEVLSNNNVVWTVLKVN